MSDVQLKLSDSISKLDVPVRAVIRKLAQFTICV